MNDTLLFDSYTSPIPELRRDIQVIPVQNNGTSVLYFHDVMGYTTPNFALDSQTETVLSLINGKTSVKEICDLSNGNISQDELLEFVQLLDQHRILNTKHFRTFSNRIEKEFEKLSVRKPILNGSSYPDREEEIQQYLNDLYQDQSAATAQSFKALYAPHIDLRVGEEQYAEAFSTLKHLQPKRVVILATSHYAGYFPDQYEGTPFIGSEKTFRLPHRSFETDQAYLKKLAENAPGFTLSDRAHRIEHSIEIHLLLISEIWKHDVEIVPILVGSLDEMMYHPEGDIADKLNRFSKKLNKLDTPDTFYLISGDLSHIGKKFGDSVHADLMKPNVEQIDKRFLNASVRNNPEDLLSEISEHFDSSRICGFPPLFTFMNAFPELHGEQINYHWWDEQRTESAVSFGSILYK
ncbi:AmmeMemoRadiSam system protein B [Rhodohalobacter halophilus]|uniref:AmmeMemoRadiSam system protein B n=1 Tax=Rhodohalobacter halophilus TaxID=1812810 RepID=UPI00083F935E|nr:AmmeMemoRadiSam system protein B [Rhodohalobacter halophilus]